MKSQETARAGPGLLTVKDVASHLGVSHCTVYRLVKKREIPYVQIGHDIRFKLGDVDVWVEARKAKPLPVLNLPADALTLPPICHIKGSHGKTGGIGEMAKAKSRARLNFGYGAIFQRKTKDGRARWYLDFKDATGKRVQRVVKNALSPQDAARALQEATQLERPQDAGRPIQNAPVLFEDFAELFYENYILANLKRPSTERLRLMVLVEFFRGHELTGITPIMIEKFRYQRLKLGNARATINRYLAVMKKLYNVAINEGVPTSNPVRKVRFYSEAENLKERILTHEEEERLLGAAPAHLRPILVIALNTGMRWSEIVNLTWRDIDLKAGLIHVVKAKSGKPRLININSVLHEELTALRAKSSASPYVLPSMVTGKPYASLYRCFIKACKAVGVTGLRFHDLRHTFATRLVQGGADIETVRVLLGHHSIIMTQRYTHSSYEMKQRAVESLAQKGPAQGPKTGAICDTVVTREPNRASVQPAEISLTSSASVS